jgi:hypothetical protein
MAGSTFQGTPFDDWEKFGGVIGDGLGGFDLLAA